MSHHVFAVECPTVPTLSDSEMRFTISSSEVRQFLNWPLLRLASAAWRQHRHSIDCSGESVPRVRDLTNIAGYGFHWVAQGHISTLDRVTPEQLASCRRLRISVSG